MSESGGATRHLLHVFPSFTVGGSQTRFGQLVAAHGNRYRHTVISLDGKLDMASRLPPAAEVDCRTWTGIKKGLLKPVRESRRELSALKPDVLVTYNWGSMNWCLANRWLPIAPHVHIEDGFGPEERNAQLRRRVWTRRLALSGDHTTVIVPSQRLREIALGTWRLPEKSVRYIPNGVQIERFASAQRPRRGDGIVVGTVATLRPEKNLGRLIRCFADVASEDSGLRLLIVGDGPLRPQLEKTARETAVSERIEFAGAVSHPEERLAQMDVFALSSDTEQMPLSVLEAMASGLPVVSFDVGDVTNMVAEENRPYAGVDLRDDRGYLDAMRTLTHSEELRTRLGEANRATVRKQFDHAGMVAAYAKVFG